MVGHEAVQRMAAVSGVADGGILREYFVVRPLGPRLQVVDIVDACRTEHGIGLDKHRKAARSGCLIIAPTVTFSTRHSEHLPRKVGRIILVLVHQQRVGQPRQLQRLAEQRCLGVNSQLFAHQQTGGLRVGSIADVVNIVDVNGHIVIHNQQLLCL